MGISRKTQAVSAGSNKERVPKCNRSYSSPGSHAAQSLDVLRPKLREGSSDLKDRRETNKRSGYEPPQINFVPTHISLFESIVASIANRV